MTRSRAPPVAATWMASTRPTRLRSPAAWCCTRPISPLSNQPKCGATGLPAMSADSAESTGASCVPVMPSLCARATAASITFFAAARSARAWVSRACWSW